MRRGGVGVGEVKGGSFIKPVRLFTRNLSNLILRKRAALLYIEIESERFMGKGEKNQVGQVEDLVYLTHTNTLKCV